MLLESFPLMRIQCVFFPLLEEQALLKSMIIGHRCAGVPLHASSQSVSAMLSAFKSLCKMCLLWMCKSPLATPKWQEKSLDCNMHA